MHEGKVVVWEKYIEKIAKQRREVKDKQDRERYTHQNADLQKTALRDKKAMQKNRG